jgi:hypothetical protein
VSSNFTSDKEDLEAIPHPQLQIGDKQVVITSFYVP